MPDQVGLEDCLEKLQSCNTWAGAMAQHRPEQTFFPVAALGSLRLLLSPATWGSLFAISSLYLIKIILYQGTTLSQEDAPVFAEHGGHAYDPTIWETEARGFLLTSRPEDRLQFPARWVTARPPTHLHTFLQ